MAQLQPKHCHVCQRLMVLDPEARCAYHATGNSPTISLTDVRIWKDDGVRGELGPVPFVLAGGCRERTVPTFDEEGRRTDDELSAFRAKRERERERAALVRERLSLVGEEKAR